MQTLHFSANFKIRVVAFAVCNEHHVKTVWIDINTTSRLQDLFTNTPRRAGSVCSTPTIFDAFDGICNFGPSIESIFETVEAELKVNVMAEGHYCKLHLPAKEAWQQANGSLNPLKLSWTDTSRGVEYEKHMLCLVSTCSLSPGAQTRAMFEPIKRNGVDVIVDIYFRVKRSFFVFVPDRSLSNTCCILAQSCILHYPSH